MRKINNLELTIGGEPTTKCFPVWTAYGETLEECLESIDKRKPQSL